jgi:hypothetical protein
MPGSFNAVFVALCNASREHYVNDRRLRLTLALVAAAGTGLIFAEGILISGWIEVVLCIPIVLTLFPRRSQAFDRILQNCLLFLIGISFSLVGLDLILRPTFGHKLHYSPFNMTSHRLPELPIVGRWDRNLTLEAESYGDLAAMAGDPTLREGRHIVFRTDEYGFRNIPGSHERNLLILGDSFPAGGGTTDDEVFARLLETQYGFRTYNLSFPGGPYEQFINFAIEWPRLNLESHSRMIWTWYTGNDMDDDGGDVWDLTQLPWTEGISAWRVQFKTYRNRSPLRQWIEAIRIRVKGTPKWVITRYLPDGTPFLFLDGQERWAKASRAQVEQHPNYTKMLRTMDAMQKLTEGRHIDLTILILPTKGEVYRWILEGREPQPDDSRASGFAEAILAACLSKGLMCQDLKPYLMTEAKRLYKTEGKLLWWRDDSHLGKHGHAAIAWYIARCLHASSTSCQ